MTVTQHVAVESGAGGPRVIPPRSTAPATRLAVFLAVVLIAVGALALRDSATAVGWVNGSPWLVPLVLALDGFSPRAWLLPAAVVLVIVGLLCVVCALLPRRQIGVSVRADSAVYVELDDVARLASAAAASVAGVIGSRSTASRRRVTVRCRVAGGKPDVEAAIRAAVADELAVLKRTPKITVRVQMEQRA